MSFSEYRWHSLVLPLIQFEYNVRRLGTVVLVSEETYQRVPMSLQKQIRESFFRSISSKLPEHVLGSLGYVKRQDSDLDH